MDTSSIESEKSMALRVKTHGDTDAKTNFGKPRTPAGEPHFLCRVRVDSKITYKYILDLPYIIKNYLPLLSIDGLVAVFTNN